MSEGAIKIKTSTKITSGNEFDREIWAVVQHQMHEKPADAGDADTFMATITVHLELKESDSLIMSDLHAAAVQRSYDILLRFVSEIESQRQ